MNQATQNYNNIINIPKITKIIKLIYQGQMQTKAIKSAYRKYQLYIENVSEQSLMKMAEKVSQKKTKISQKQQNYDDNDDQKFWIIGQQKLFIIILAFISYLNNIDLYSASQNSLQPLSEIFISKQPRLLLFQVKCLVNTMASSKSTWTLEQENLLFSIVTQHMKTQKQAGNEKVTKWKLISYQFFNASSAFYFRSPRYCRQKWNNHLNPKVAKGQWDIDEQILLFKLIEKYGFKWALIAKNLKVRTENMVKNKANSIIKNLLQKKIKKISQNNINIILKKLNNLKEQKEYVKKTQNQIQFHQKIDNSFNFENKQTYPQISYTDQEHNNYFNPFDVLDITKNRSSMITIVDEDSWQYNQQQNNPYEERQEYIMNDGIGKMMNFYFMTQTDILSTESQSIYF